MTRSPRPPHQHTDTMDAAASTDSPSVNVSLNLEQTGTTTRPNVLDHEAVTHLLDNDHVHVLVVPDDLHAPSLARAWLTDHLAELTPDIVADAVTMISELVTNAVLHGRPDVLANMRVTPSALRVAVADQGPMMPVIPDQQVDPAQVFGRGLFIVNELATTWGVEPHPGPPGKTVWFTLNTI